MAVNITMKQWINESAERVTMFRLWCAQHRFADAMLAGTDDWDSAFKAWRDSCDANDGEPSITFEEYIASIAS